MDSKAEAARDQAWYEYNTRHPNASKREPGGWGYASELGRVLQAEDARMRVYDRYWDQMVSQVRYGYNLSRVSPAGVYRRTMESVAGSGLDHYGSFLKQVRQYKHTIRSFVLDHYPLDIHRSYGMVRTHFDTSEKIPEFVEALSTTIFTADEIPKFSDKHGFMTDAIRNSMWNVAILVLWNVALLMAAEITFLYQDIK